MKKALPVLLLIIAFITAITSAAAYIDTAVIKANSGENISIPVRIAENSGIMGFKIRVEYPEVFENPSVMRGDVTSNGNFNDSITVSDNGAFEVLWNSTADVKGEGVLFNLNLKIKDDAPDGEYTIQLICSQPDTFNEKWQDVELGTQCVKVTVGEPEQSGKSITTAIFEMIENLFKFIMDIIRNSGVTG